MARTRLLDRKLNAAALNALSATITPEKIEWSIGKDKKGNENRVFCSIQRKQALGGKIGAVLRGRRNSGAKARMGIELGNGAEYVVHADPSAFREHVSVSEGVGRQAVGGEEATAARGLAAKILQKEFYHNELGPIFFRVKQALSEYDQERGSAPLERYLARDQINTALFRGFYGMSRGEIRVRRGTFKETRVGGKTLAVAAKFDFSDPRYPFKASAVADLKKRLVVARMGRREYRFRFGEVGNEDDGEEKMRVFALVRGKEREVRGEELEAAIQLKRALLGGLANFLTRPRHNEVKKQIVNWGAGAGIRIVPYG